jgi:hypothetical protein|tara:strand:- start:17 stop:238 length:222 start_codon:yes stop_codon:yes gene_type:complete
MKIWPSLLRGPSTLLQPHFRASTLASELTEGVVNLAHNLPGRLINLKGNGELLTRLYMIMAPQAFSPVILQIQ